MQFDTKSLIILEETLNRLETGFSGLPDLETGADLEALRKVLSETADRMQDNFPYHHPFYAGQMLKPPHPVARLAYMLAIWINPNNHALDGGRASSVMEKEAVAEIANLFGWTTFLGHLCGGGTIANLEALWIAGNLHPGKTVAASEQAHYTHRRISEVLQLSFQAVACDTRGRMDPDALEDLLKAGSVGTVVATAGTTGTGAVDSIPDLLELREKYGFRLHVDAAYGGYFILADNLDPGTRKSLDRIGEADSIVIDPHKHGLQPYGCGCVLFKDPGVGRFYKHDSPYTYFSSEDLHLGEISLECSRPGASAVALWATQKLLPLVRGSEFAVNLGKCRQAALWLYEKLSRDPRYLTLFEPELDIVVWAPRNDRISRISELSEKLFKQVAAENLHLAKMTYPVERLQEAWKNVVMDREHVTCLRACLMKPEHKEWIGRIWEVLDKITDSVLAG
jgi:glutamate/tyrosine decarboxylase-like PLP-dependent enzyme